MTLEERLLGLIGAIGADIRALYDAQGGGAGIAEIDFGVNGAFSASVYINTGDPAIGIWTTVITCGIRAMGSADHSMDEHLIEEMDIRAGNIVNGSGFEIFAIARKFPLYGKYNVFYRWS